MNEYWDPLNESSSLDELSLQNKCLFVILLVQEDGISYKSSLGRAAVRSSI